MEWSGHAQQRDGLGGLLGSATDLRDSDQLLVKARYRFCAISLSKELL